MLTTNDLKAALDQYDSNKGFWRRLFGDQEAIKQLRSLYENTLPASRQLSIRELILVKKISAETIIGTASYKAFKELKIPAENRLVDNSSFYLFQNKHGEEFVQDLQKSLDEFDNKKNWFQRLFGLGDNAHIKNVRQFLRHVSDENYEGMVLSEAYEASWSAKQAHLNLYGNFSQAIASLKRDDQLNQENFSTVIRSERAPKEVANALKQLNQVNLSTPEYKQKLMRHSDPKKFGEGLVLLHNQGLLNSKTLDTFNNANAYNPKHVSYALISLHENGLLNAVTHKAVKEHRFPPDLVNSFLMLNEMEIEVSQDIVDLILQRLNNNIQDHINFANGLIILKQADILTKENMESISSNFFSNKFASALVRLNDSNLLTAENRAVLKSVSFSSDNLNPVTEALCQLDHVGMLNDQNRLAFIQNTKQCSTISQMIQKLSQSNLNMLNQDNFDKVICNLSIFSKHLKDKSSDSIFTQDFFDSLKSTENVKPKISQDEIFAENPCESTPSFDDETSLNNSTASPF